MTKKVGNIIKGLFFLLLLALTPIIFVYKVIIACKYRVTTKDGVDDSLYLELGGIKQFVQIRGNDVSNPVAIFLHGGPGFPVSYLSYYYQVGLLSNYTIISWDQRGCGRTYYKNKGDQTGLSTEQILKDLDELVSYAKSRFNKDKVIIIGQSWGSVLGSIYVASNPQNVSAYVGIGQAVDFDAGKIFAAEQAIVEASKQGNIEDARKMQQAIKKFSQAKTASDLDIDNLETMLITPLQYLPARRQIPAAREVFIGITSPDMNFCDLCWFFKATNTAKITALQEPLVNYSYFEFMISQLGSSFDVPIYIIQGEDDWITPTSMVEEYFETVHAPDKEIIVMPGCGHTPFIDDPEEFALGFKSLLSRRQ